MRLIDLHTDIITKVSPKKFARYVSRAKKHGVTAILASVWTTEMADPLREIRHCRKTIDGIDGDIFLHIEDCWFLTHENIDEIIALRPFSVGLTWNADNAIAGGAHGDGDLGEFGKWVIKKFIDAGVRIDLAHLNRKSFNSVADFLRTNSSSPLLCTHTAFDEITPHNRNLSREQIKTIVDSGGVVGLSLVGDFLNPTGHATFDDVFKHVKYFIDNFGDENLSIGTDLYGTKNLPRGIRGYVDFSKLCGFFLKKGLGADTVQKIFYKNADRLMLDMTFEKLCGAVKNLGHIKGVKKRTIGHSILGRPIFAYRTGGRKNPIIITGGIHAREWITTLTLIEFVKIYSRLGGAIYFVPLCNPDGAKIALDGHPMWKANARGVDLNVNFDSDWGRGYGNTTTPGAQNCIGEYPHSEPEVRALADFTKKIKPRAVVAYHSKGEVVYYRDDWNADFAALAAAVTGYAPEKTKNSTGGYCDWVADLGIPAITIEVGNDALSHPITAEHLDEIVARNIWLPIKI